MVAQIVKRFPESLGPSSEPVVPKLPGSFLRARANVSKHRGETAAQSAEATFSGFLCLCSTVSFRRQLMAARVCEQEPGGLGNAGSGNGAEESWGRRGIRATISYPRRTGATIGRPPTFSRLLTAVFVSWSGATSAAPAPAFVQSARCVFPFVDS